MRTLAAVILAILISGCLFAQNRGTVVSPPRIVMPSGAGFRGTNGFNQNGFGRPGFRGGPGRALGSGYAAYPIYVGGFYGGYYGDGSYDGSYDSSYMGMGQQAAPQQGSVTIVYPPQPAPVIINQFGPPGAGPYAGPAGAPGQSQTSEPPDASSIEPAHYLIAFKDHTIYSAVAYWVDGETLHYFTTGNTHNQVSIALVDRDLTARLNKDSGVEVKLPPAK